MRLILIGPPGVGKGTQSALLVERLGVLQISSGEIFRREIEANTDLGRLAQRYISHGELVPNGVTIEMMAKKIREPQAIKHGFVLDGFPRTVKQAMALTEIMDELDESLDKVVSLEAPEELIVSRLSARLGCTRCGEIYHAVNKPPMREELCDKCDGPLFVRQDDLPETIRERLRVFREQTAPVIDFYKDKGVLVTINGSLEAEGTYALITAVTAKV